jgi:hypothetical protein
VNYNEVLDAAVAKLDAMDSSDPELAHQEADLILLDFVPEEIADAYRRLVRRCAWWACA